MRITFTRNDLVRKLYGETEPTEDQAMEVGFVINLSLMDEYDSMVEVKELLDAPKYTPSDVCIESILDYSRRTAPAETTC